MDEAIAEYREAIRLKKDDSVAHNNLGAALHAQGKLKEAGVEYRKAIALDAKLAVAHGNLGAALCVQGKVADAIACFHKAIALDAKDAKAHTNLGNALHALGKLDEAVAEHRKAIALDPNLATAHNNLGFALYQKGKLDEAVAEFRKAIALDPKFATARTNLARAERMAAVQDKLPAFQNGSYKPASNVERLALAGWCQIKKLHHTATHQYAAAFADEPKLAYDHGAAHRYNAACHAALAGCGQGKDAADLPEKERSRLRQQALDWLRADLDAWGKLLKKEPDKASPIVLKTMRHWQLGQGLRRGAWGGSDRQTARSRTASLAEAVGRRRAPACQRREEIRCGQEARQEVTVRRTGA